MWHKATAKWRKSGKLVVLGVVQEQHTDRPRLYAQWQGIQWPILQDPLNVFETKAVPRLIAIDEHGIIRSRRPRLRTFAADFINKKFTAGATTPAPPPINRRHRDVTKRLAGESEARHFRRMADELYLWKKDPNLSVTAYKKAVRLDPQDEIAKFRLGVALRRRSESRLRVDTDFQQAIKSWEAALKLDPNQYIWRRRIQQYGPRLSKPYPFYDWVQRAEKAIRARGEKPVRITVPLTGSEQASPSRKFSVTKPPANPDPQARIDRDKTRLIQPKVTIVPSRPRAGGTVRVHVTMTPNVRLKAHWNNESQPLRLWLDPPEGWKASRQLVSAPQPKKAATKETRLLDFELQIPVKVKGTFTVPAYALYFVCEDVNGTCFFLRQEIPIKIPVE